MDNELRQFTSDKDLSGNALVAWNYEEFEVNYQCLAEEIKIGDYYIRLILEKDDWPQNLVKNPYVSRRVERKFHNSSIFIFIAFHSRTELSYSMHCIDGFYVVNVLTMIN